MGFNGIKQHVNKWRAYKRLDNGLSILGCCRNHITSYIYTLDQSESFLLTVTVWFVLYVCHRTNTDHHEDTIILLLHSLSLPDPVCRSFQEHKHDFGLRCACFVVHNMLVGFPFFFFYVIRSINW